MFMESPQTTVKDCLFFGSKPSTPPEVKKYRRTSSLEPGQRFQHYGIVDDLKTMNLDQNIYGVTSEKTAATASELLTHKKLSELEKINLVKSEKVYKGAAREPLGKTVDRSIKLPSKFDLDGEGRAFGVTSKSSLEPAKAIIFPDVPDGAYEGEEVYKISHGSWQVGEQKRRNYQWPSKVNPTTTVFGNKGDEIALNGVSRNIAVVLNPPLPANIVVNSKRSEDMHNSFDTLGRSKNLGQDSSLRPFSMVYGKSSNAGKKSKAQASAYELIRGRYTDEAQKPEADLGKSLTPGFRNISLEDRAFGVPSIRTDLPARPAHTRSVADSQNYGDDVPAQDLINPPAFSDISISPHAMNDQRPKAKVLQTFRNIGYDIDDDILEVIWNVASQDFPPGFCSVNMFRNVLNDYLNAVELGNEAYWLHNYAG